MKKIILIILLILSTLNIYSINIKLYSFYSFYYDKELSTTEPLVIKQDTTNMLTQITIIPK